MTIVRNLAPVALALLLAGCGGGDSGQTFEKQAVWDCLEEQSEIGATTDASDSSLTSNLVTDSATLGFVMAGFGVQGEDGLWDQEVQIAFEESESDAGLLADEERELIGERKADDLIEQNGNVVIVWGNLPSADERQTVTGCLP